MACSSNRPVSGAIDDDARATAPGKVGGRGHQNVLLGGDFTGRYFRLEVGGNTSCQRVAFASSHADANVLSRGCVGHRPTIEPAYATKGWLLCCLRAAGAVSAL